MRLKRDNSLVGKYHSLSRTVWLEGRAAGGQDILKVEAYTDENGIPEAEAIRKVATWAYYQYRWLHGEGGGSMNLTERQQEEVADRVCGLVSNIDVERFEKAKEIRFLFIVGDAGLTCIPLYR